MKVCRRFFLTSVMTLLAMIFVMFGMAYAIDLEKIQEAIQKKGARWVAGRTTISELPDELKLKRLGVIAPSEKGKAPKYEPKTQELPAYFDWRDAGMVSPIKDQGDCGSCWAFGSVAALESLWMIEKGLSSDDSEQFVVSYNLSNYGCDGGIMNRVYNFLEKQGTVTEDCMPYRENDKKLPFPCQEWKEEIGGISAWSWVEQNVDAIKAAVYENPIPAAFNVYEDFFYYTGGVYNYVDGDYAGGHAILIIGWDDNEPCFIVKNSWGEGWGENGYFRIAYSQVLNEVQFGQDAADFDGVWPTQ